MLVDLKRTANPETEMVLGKAAGLMQILQPFAALYVLILAILGPLLAKESKHVLKVLDKVFKFEKRHLQRLAQNKIV